jgi:hypothetical protein
MGFSVGLTDFADGHSVYAQTAQWRLAAEHHALVGPDRGPSGGHNGGLDEQFDRQWRIGSFSRADTETCLQRAGVCRARLPAS